MLAAYKPKSAPAASYTIESPPSLLTDAVRPLFEALRKEVRALDPCVTEESLKLYVAYKAEANVMSLVRQSFERQMGDGADT